MCLDCLLDAKQVLVIKNSYRFILYSLFDKSSRPGPSVIILPANAQLFFLFFEVFNQKSLVLSPVSLIPRPSKLRGFLAYPNHAFSLTAPVVVK